VLVLVGELLDAAEGLVSAAVVDKEYFVIGVFFKHFDKPFGKRGDVVLFVKGWYDDGNLCSGAFWSCVVHYSGS